MGLSELGRLEDRLFEQAADASELADQLANARGQFPRRPDKQYAIDQVQAALAVLNLAIDALFTRAGGLL